jgi:hypothetical protein
MVLFDAYAEVFAGGRSVGLYAIRESFVDKAARDT